MFYSDLDYDRVLNECSSADGIIIRVNPGKYEGVTQSKLKKLVK